MKANLLMTPNTDVPLILGIQVMAENKVSIDFHSKQLMMEKESNVVKLLFAYKPEFLRHVQFVRRKHNPVLIKLKQRKKHGTG